MGKKPTAGRKLLVSPQINGIIVHVTILNAEEGGRSRDGNVELGPVSAVNAVYRYDQNLLHTT